MNEAEIIAATRQLVIDMKELGQSEIIKHSALRLLSHDSGTPSGAINEWYNRERDPSRKLVLREMISIIAKAWRDKQSNEGDKLLALCDRMRVKEIVLTDNDIGLLETMLSMNATADTPPSSRMILESAHWTSEGKHAFDRLKKAGFVKAAKGIGYYLTEAGIAKAKKVGAHLVRT